MVQFCSCTMHCTMMCLFLMISNHQFLKEKIVWWRWCEWWCGWWRSHNHPPQQLSVISESLTELRGDLKGAEENLLEDRLEKFHKYLCQLFLRISSIFGQVDYIYCYHPGCKGNKCWFEGWLRWPEHLQVRLPSFYKIFRSQSNMLDR